MEQMDNYLTTSKIVVCNKGGISIKWVKKDAFFKQCCDN